MNALSFPWTAFWPEITLALVIVGVFGIELFAKSSSSSDGKVVPASLWGMGLVGAALMGSVPSFSQLMKFYFLGSGFVTLVMVKGLIPALEKKAADFSLLILVALLGTFFLASAEDLITLFITVEWLTISLYILTAYLSRQNDSIEAGVKYLIMGAFAAAFFLYGISLIYGSTGSVHFHAIQAYLEKSPRGNSLLWLGFLLILAGIGFKIAAFPFQFWVPDVYQGAPTAVTAFLSTASKAAGFVALIKVLFGVIGLHSFHWPALIAILSAATLLYGNLGALGQHNMKRLFAYSSIAHAGYLLMGISSGSRQGLSAAIFYLIVYGLSNLTAFLVIANPNLNGGTISSYRGLSKRSPIMAAAFFISLLSLGGIPPLAGFFGKFLVIQAMLQEGNLWLAMLGAVNVIISLYYYLLIVKEMYVKRPERGQTKILLTRPIQILFWILMTAVIGLGVFQAPLFNLADSVSSSLVQ